MNCRTSNVTKIYFIEVLAIYHLNLWHRPECLLYFTYFLQNFVFQAKHRALWQMMFGGKIDGALVILSTGISLQFGRHNIYGVNTKTYFFLTKYVPSKGDECF